MISVQSQLPGITFVMAIYQFLVVLVVIGVTQSLDYHLNFYLGKYEDRDKMDILFRRSQRSESKSGKDERLAETLTYPLSLGSYGGLVQAIHVEYKQSSSNVGRITLTQGHIGATSFEMIVEADHSMYLVCNYTVYGVKPFQRKKRVRVESKRITFRDEL